MWVRGKGTIAVFLEGGDVMIGGDRVASKKGIRRGEL